MNGQLIQEKIYAGYAKVATKIGTPFELRRIVDPLNGAGDLIQSDFLISLQQDAKFLKPNKYGNAVWQGMFDGRITKVFDILTDGKSTYFINSMPQILPITLIECNTTISVRRMSAPSTALGKANYGGDLRSTEKVLISNCPASQLIGQKWEHNPANLPGDTRLPYWLYLIPDVGVEIEISDVIEEPDGRRAIVTTPELTDFGWRISASVAVA